ncbi:MAG: nuclear transport factor 2 family protein [Vicinamibacteraceae bacterium]
MDDRTRITEAATALAEAIGRKDANAIDQLLAPDFRLRTPGGPSTPRDAFIAAVCAIPAEVLSVSLTGLEIDLGDGVALVSGIQHARCGFHGEVLNDVRPFADWFQRTADGRWQARVSLDLTPPV